MQPNDGRLAGRVVDGHNIEAQWALFQMALAKEVMRGANEGFVFFLSDAQFGKPEFAFHGETSANLNKRQRISIAEAGGIFCGHGIRKTSDCLAPG